jgi:predicted porin
MKKSLLAVAAMTAFAGAAQAQSSVTVYGVLDVGFVGSAYNGTAITANAATTGGPSLGGITQKQSAAGFGQSAESTSRLGFKGTEDLGGGTSAIFTLEVGISPMSNGAAYSSTTNLSQPGVFGSVNRQTFVGLKKNGVGTATIGTQYTPLFDVQSITDAAGNNNLVGNAVYSGSLQSTSGTFNGGQGPFTSTGQTVGLNEVSGAYTTRVSNALKLQSDRISGLAGQLFFAQQNQTQSQVAANFSGTSTGVGGTNNNTAWGVNLDYVWNKLQVVAATQNVKSYDPAYYPVAATATQTGATSQLAQGLANSYGLNASDQQTYAAGTYDFGILKGYLQYITRRVISQADASYSTSRSAYQVGARSQLTPTISAYATMGLGKSQYLGQGNLGNNNFRTFQIGSDYNLSKRTNLYVAYGSYNQSSAGGTTAVSNTAPQNAGISGMNYAVGIRHTF